MWSLLATTFVLFVTNCANAQNLTLGCSHGWLKLVEKCYLVVPWNHTWDRAQTFCEQYGAVLAEPKGYYLTNALSTETELEGIYRYWIGYNTRGMASSIGSTGYWSDGQLTGVEVGVWASFQPNVSSGSCAYIGEQDNAVDQKWAWFMTSCDHVMPFACERLPCPTDTHQCNNGRCVGFPNVCNSINDCGDWSDEQNCSSLCNVHLRSDSGSLEVNISNFYRANRVCLFTIEVETGHHINLQFASFDIEENLDFLEVWDGGATLYTSVLVGRVSGQNLGEFQQRYVSSTNHLIFRLLTDSSVQKQGFSFTWDTEFPCEMLQKSGTTVADTTIGYMKTLTPRQDVNSCITECERSTECWGVEYDVTQTRERNCFMITEAPVLTTSNCCQVYFKTCPHTSRVSAIASVPSFKRELMASSVSADLYTPRYPFSYIGNYESTHIITALGNRLVTLQIMSADLCCTDSIRIHDGRGPETPLLYTIEKGTKPGFVTSTGNALYIHMDLAQHWACSGVLIRYVQGCDIVLDGESGNLISPGYGVRNYPDIMTCTWKINPIGGKSLKLTFADFQLEKDKDFLEFYRGTNDTGEVVHPGFGFTGSNPTVAIVSTQGIFIRFTSSAVNNSVGFNITYTSGCPVLNSTALVVKPQSPSFHSPDNVTLSCADGYVLAGGYEGKISVVLSCQSDGSWNITNIPFCKRQYCGFAPTLINGYIVTGSGVLGGDFVQYACREGYTSMDNLTIICLSNSSWSTLPRCQAPLCEDLKTLVPGSTVNISLGDGKQHGSVVNVICPQYRELLGPKTLICKQGNWSTEIPKCQPIVCDLPVIWNAVVVPMSAVMVNDTVTVTCNSGYSLSQQNSTNTNGTFRCGVNMALKCLNINECTLGLHDCVNAKCTDTDGGYTCTCLPGYRPVGSNPKRCEDVDECSLNISFCDHNCTNNPGGYSCSCLQGYDLYTTSGFNGYQLSAGEDGTQPWHSFHIKHSCVLKKCDPSQVITISNGKALTSRKTFFYNDAVPVICDIGFYITGTKQANMTAYCGSNGQWNQRPSCEVAYCNETYGGSVTPVGAIRYDEKYTLRCTWRNGQVYVLERRCGYDMLTKTYNTTGDQLVCRETDCGKVPVYTGVKLFVTPSTRYNTTVVFDCEGQYLLRGSSPLGNNLVRCGENGTWEFGTLHCEGGQCKDPGYPANGYTTLDSWKHDQETVYTVAIGSTANFSCNIPGFQPSPVASATCRKIGNSSAAWDAAVPSCVDTEAPKFSNCPADLSVDAYSEVFYVEPTATDNAVVKTLAVFPENFKPGMVLGSTSSVTYIATDTSNNQQWCQFRILIRDVTPPAIFCDLPPVATANAGNLVIYPTTYVRTDDPRADVVASPESINVNYGTVGSNPIITFSATDSSKNIATCQSQMKITAQKCNPASVHVYNGNTTCLPNGQGYVCTISCKTGFVFYENASVSAITVSCKTGEDWSRNMPVCTASDLSHYRYSVKFKYDRIEYLDVSCGAVYEQDIRNKLIELTTSFTSLCYNASSASELDVSPAPYEPISAEVTPLSGTLEATLTLDLTPQGLSDADYFICSQRIFQAFSKVTASVSSIDYLPGTQFCPQVHMQSSSTSQVTAAFVCSSNAQAADLQNGKHICLACIPGTFKSGDTCVACAAGTYTDDFYAASCKSCPDNTNSKKTAAMYKNDCYDDCALNLYSASGKAPCTDCPIDSYWVNSTYCAPCPQNTYTKRRGAKSVQECIATCSAGYFSHDGLLDCTLCPKNYYQPSSRAKGCTECPSHQITIAAGSTSSVDCKDGYASLCGSNRCQNNGTCLVIRHDFYCNCSVGFTGRTCETPLSPCDLKPCLNGGNCTALGLTQYNCTCLNPFSGTNCEVDFDHCNGTVCNNNGTCIDQKGSSICACSSHSGYYGSSCQYPQNPCLRFPCKNSGVCIAQSSYNRVCKCSTGFTGVDCETNINECSSQPCMNGAPCIDGENSFICDCPVGYKGLYCEQRNRNYTCSSDACNTGLSCIDNYIDNVKHCTCTDGWYYDIAYGVCAVNNQYCDKIDCGAVGTCFTYDDGYHVKCRCEAGYTGTACQSNIDDCAYRPCSNNGTCQDAVNSFSCTCPVPGTGGSNCTDNNNGCFNCNSSNTVNCTDKIDGCFCYCKQGFRGSNCQEKIPSCESSPCQHGGTCINLMSNGSYACTCPASWTGSNCEQEVSRCVTGQECANGGRCISTSDSFVCSCVFGYTGSRCEETYNLCNRTKPCTGNNSTCTTDSNGIRCSCQQGYAGKSCETLLWYCGTDTCHNGGKCDIISGIGVVCTCQPGYTGNDCSVNINECATTVCPSNSRCVDGINTAQCICDGGKVGEQCEKNSSNDFDFVISPFGSCPEGKKHSTVTLNTSVFTLVFWERFTVLSNPNVIVSIYGTGTSQRGDPIVNWDWLLQVNGTGVILKDGRISVFSRFEKVNIADGLWHHITVVWRIGTMGFVTLYVDGKFNKEDTFRTNILKAQFGSVIFGEETFESDGYIGRISRIQVFREEIDNANISRLYQGTTSLSYTSVIDQDDLQSIYTVDYSSQLTRKICTSATQCPDRAFNASRLPAVVYCPDDVMLVADRVSTASWPTPTFSRTDKTTRASTAFADETQFGWGVHGIAVAEYSADQSAAVCSFTLYKKREGCTQAVLPSGLAKQCSDLSDGFRCNISCSQQGNSLTAETPTYYTCSKFGMWDQAERVTEFIYPTCSPFSAPRKQLEIKFNYTVLMECNSMISNMSSQVKSRIELMNKNWNNGFCKTDQGANDITCNFVEIDIKCSSPNIAAVGIVFKNVGDSVGTPSNTETTEAAIKISIIDRIMFNLASVATLQIPSLTVAMSKYCSGASQLINDQCVTCGDGYFFNSSSGRCVPCTNGSYRTVLSYTSPFSDCTKCPGSFTTSNTGATSQTFCHASCFYGKYYDGTSCALCPVGEFNDVIGSSTCTQCAVTHTTLTPGNIHANSCIPFSSLYTTSSLSPVPVGKSTGEEDSLSGGEIAAIVIGSLIAAVIIALIVILIVTKRGYCFANDKKVVPKGPYKHVSKYGETNLKFVNYRLSDVREMKERNPVYEEPPTPEDSVSMRGDISFHVPVFIEKLNGTIQQKRTFVSSTVNSDVDMKDHHRREGHNGPSVSKEERVNLDGSLNSESGRITKPLKERRSVNAELNLSVSSRAGQAQRGWRQGRPPADLTPELTTHSTRRLSPLRDRPQNPELHLTSEYIRPLPSQSRFQEATSPSTSRAGSRSGSGKILLESDDEDLR